MGTIFHLSPEAQKAKEESAIRAELYAHAQEPCSVCGHPRRNHGRVKCFAQNCPCRGGFHTEQKPPSD